LSNALSLCSSLNHSDQASHPYKTTGKITVSIFQSPYIWTSPFRNYIFFGWFCVITGYAVACADRSQGYVSNETRSHMCDMSIKTTIFDGVTPYWLAIYCWRFRTFMPPYSGQAKKC
jgi:hypothetical protein